MLELDGVMELLLVLVGGAEKEVLEKVLCV